MKLKLRVYEAPNQQGSYLYKLCISGPSLVIPVGTGDKLSCREAQNMINLYFEMNFTLKVKFDQPQRQYGS